MSFAESRVTLPDGVAGRFVGAGELTHCITINIRGLCGFAVRLFVARLLFRLGAWVAGVNIIME